MLEFCKEFSLHSDYLSYKNSDNYVLPNVSWCKDMNDIHYGKYVRDYSKEYLTFEALEDTVFSIEFRYDSIIHQGITPAMRESFSYSIDDGKTWVTFETPSDEYSGTALTTPTIHAGEKVLWKGIGTLNRVAGPLSAYCYFTSSGEYIAYGNMMSIIYGDMFINKYDLENTNDSFSNFFFSSSYLISVQNLILPATTLANECYLNMFYGCTSLTTPPELPATTLANACYYNMFLGCTSLTTAPELPATTLANGCYSGMFYGCTSLTTPPELPATTLATSCYNNMFYGCTSLAETPDLHATTLERICYGSMFNGCTSLTTAPELPATTLADSCYSGMFRGCTSLTEVPELPATTLANSCYNDMFNNCSNLNYIKAMFTTTPTTDYTRDWVDGVASTGTFVKNSAATWTTTGVNGVPTGWTVQTASA